MKRTALVLFTLTALSSILFARQRPSQQLSKASIELAGVKLHLGMAKADVAERFVGTQIQKMSEDSWIIGKNGTVRFKNEKLVFADRSWINAGDDQIDAIFAVVSSLNREGYSACKVLAETLSLPLTDVDTGRTVAVHNLERVWIGCGGKTVLILKSKIGDRLNEDVSEQLGVLELNSK